jgi:hypothetical protein
VAEGKNKYGEPVLHSLVADWFAQNKEYGYAQRHYIRSDSPDKFAVMLVLFAKEGHPSEADLFIARAVLQLSIFNYLFIPNALVPIHLDTFAWGK